MPKGVYVRTKEHRKNLSKALKSRVLSEEWKRNISEGLKNHLVSPETRRKLSEAHEGRIITEEWRKNMSKAHKCEKHSKERKAKNRDVQIERYKDPKEREKTSKAMNRPDVKERHKKAMRIAMNRPETKKKNSEAHKGKMPKSLNYPLTNKSGPFGHIKKGWYDINGKRIFFRSKWEANYALYLDFLVKYKQIKKWFYEKDVFMFDKIKFGTRSYRPDFKVYNNDKDFEYHEVKGYMDAGSKTKIKRMAKYYPKVKLIIIDGEVYEDIRKKLWKMLKFY